MELIERSPFVPSFAVLAAAGTCGGESAGLASPV
jgi:hypothetical protein